jgi:hypothetical protein
VKGIGPGSKKEQGIKAGTRHPERGSVKSQGRAVTHQQSVIIVTICHRAFEFILEPSSTLIVTMEEDIQRHLPSSL